MLVVVVVLMVLHYGEKFSSPSPTAQHQQNAGVTHPPRMRF
jgi:hypothetical protein